ncbi:vWA domain-containing protein [Thermomonospora cellulosilytica]|uniref:VWA domain-containing protein n=1 Tax=Thermomonospora cellulosilytica TaxID=1411118 RepID=A0A7W3N1R4_9ACTN|nr:vWA domain-containing protein [Thermomonospora cellulosilytica]MBA9005884.1 hypothetical protein [Thermomonospora cellulosilytica]
MSATHLNPGTDQQVRPTGAWLRLSAAMAEMVVDLADRDDLAVVCAPNAGRGAPGCFLPNLAQIEIDGTHLGSVDVNTCNPLRSGDISRYPALWGVLAHEAAHARHTRWDPPQGVDGAQVEAAILLEEPRIEGRQLTRRPVDQRWLRSSAGKIVLDDFDPSQQMDAWQAAHLAALMLGRRDAGVFTDREVKDVEQAIALVLGAPLLRDLQDIWRAALATGDEDAAGMLELGRRWCKLLGQDPEQPREGSGDGQQGNGNPSGNPGQQEQQGQQGPAPASPLGKAVSEAVRAVQKSEDRKHSKERRAAEQTAKAIADAERAREQAAKVFNREPGGANPGGYGGATRIVGTRRPLPAEDAMARQLARQLRNAAHRERATTVTTSPVPPGRLRMRGALAAAAQRAAGQMPTAEPFVQVTRRQVPNPPLRVGIACDVSGSMKPFEDPIASTAYVLNKAASHVTDAVAATVIYGYEVRAVTFPGEAPTKVREFAAVDGCHQLGAAVQALDIALGLYKPGAARLLVIVSDGRYSEHEKRAAQKEVTRLVKSGCAVLWIALGEAFPLEGAHLVKLDDPSKAAAVIGQAAVRALRTA